MLEREFFKTYGNITCSNGLNLVFYAYLIHYYPNSKTRCDRPKYFRFLFYTPPPKKKTSRPINYTFFKCLFTRQIP